METQLASAAIWVPTFCHVGPTTLPFQETAPVPKHQIIHPALLPSGQHVIVPQAASGQLLVHATQQLVPFLPPDAQRVLPCSEFLSQKVLVHPLQYLPATTSPAVFETGCQQPISKLQQMQTKLSTDCLVPALHKTQRRKKVSPSAKRRSRLRLIAFLEAKKEKCKASTSSESDPADGRISDSEESSVSSAGPSDATPSPSGDDKKEMSFPCLPPNSVVTSCVE